MSDVQKAGAGYRRKLLGRVVSDRMTKTVVVECVTRSRDSLYGKYVKTRKRFKVHDESSVARMGDEVEIQENAPISRHKRYIVTRILKKFVQE